MVDAAGTVPAWRLCDRLRRSLSYAGMNSGDMADYLEVEPSTVSRWFSERTNPSPATLRLWALRTGVSYEWLRGDVRRQGLEPRTRWLRHAHLELVA
jgi:transcriptional regulator with XRE-family HTH domain